MAVTEKVKRSLKRVASTLLMSATFSLVNAEGKAEVAGKSTSGMALNVVLRFCGGMAEIRSTTFMPSPVTWPKTVKPPF